MEPVRLGELLRKEGMISDLQLREALQIQKEERQRIGDILVELGYMTKRQLRHIIRKYKRRIPLGEYLVEGGTITAAQLEYALNTKTSAQMRLGEILMEARIITEEQLAQALSQQLDMPYIVPFPRMVDREVFDRLPPNFIRHNRILPLTQTDGVTTVLIPGPIDDALTFHLEGVFGQNIELAMCSLSKIEETISAVLEHMAMTEVPEVKTGIDVAPSLTETVRVDITSDKLKLKRAETQAIDLANYIIGEAMKDRASDIHLESMPDRVRVRFRIDGLLTHKTDLPNSIRDTLFRRIKLLAGLNIADDTHREREGRLTGSIDEMEVDMRVSVFVGIYGETITMRLLRQDVGMMDLEDLGMTPNAYAMSRRALDYSSGIVFFTGPTGAGKTTSMYASLNYVNKPDLNVVTVENPVEYLLDGALQAQISLYRGATLGELVREAIRQDPDVIAVGEVVDNSQAGDVLRASLTGHKVLTTFHAEDAVGAAFRLLDAGVMTFFKSSTAITIVCQRLVRKICPNCRHAIAPDPQKIREFRLRDFDPDKHDFFQGSGCAECQNTGFVGRTGIFEVLTINDRLREAFLTGAKARDILQTARATTAFLNLHEVGMLKAIRGVTTIDEVARMVPLASRDRETESPLTIQEIERTSEGAFVK